MNQISRSMKQSLYTAIVFAIVLIVFFLAPRRGVSADKPEANFVSELSGARAAVKILYPKRAVEMSLLDREHLGLPNAIQISLFDKEGRRFDVEMNTIDSESLSKDLVNQRKYFGHIPAAVDSYVGVSIRIPFTRSRTSTVLNLGSTP